MFTEVNSDKLSNFKNKNIIANANCSVIPIVVALKPLHDLYNIKRIVASTYQSVSGAGKAGMDELISQTKEILDNKNVVSKILLNKLHLMQFLILIVFLKTEAQKSKKS